MAESVIQHEIDSLTGFVPFNANDSTVEFVLFGYDGDSRVVLAQSENASLALVGFCMIGETASKKVRGRFFNVAHSQPLPIMTERDARPKSLTFGWVSGREIDWPSHFLELTVKQTLDRIGLDLHSALTNEPRSDSAVRKYLGPLVYACELVNGNVDEHATSIDQTLREPWWMQYVPRFFFGIVIFLLILVATFVGAFVYQNIKNEQHEIKHINKQGKIEQLEMEIGHLRDTVTKLESQVKKTNP